MPQHNTPQLRFPEFSGAWEDIQIQSLIDKKYIISHLDGNHGALYPKSSEFVKQGIPYITANDFINGVIDFSKCKYLTPDKASKFKKGIAKTGDVLFAHNATVGPTAILKTDYEYAILSTTATYYRCDNTNLHNSYLLYYFRNNYFVEQYTAVMSQSTRNQVPITTQRLFNIKLPTLPEQQKIASFLSATDKKLEQLQQKKTLLEQYKKGMMQKLFSQQIRFKDDEGKEFPEWEEKELGEIGDIVTGKTPDTSDRTLWGGKIQFITPTDIDNKKYQLETERYVVKTDKMKLLPEKSIVFTCIASIGKMALTVAPAITNQQINSIVPFNRYNNEFIYYSVLYISPKIKATQANTTLPIINKTEFSKFKIAIANLSEQTKIADFLTAIDAKIAAVSAQVTAAKGFKKGLLQQMFV